MPIIKTLTGRAQCTSVSSTAKVYRRSFVKHVHALVEMGYHALTAGTLSSSEEPDITGQLVAAINDTLSARSGPSWRSHFCVKDDPPVGRVGGRSRPRVDIEFERTSPMPRPHYQFEAKRLHSSGCVGRYLGADGLQSFITQRYAPDDAEAGMLGYVQVPYAGAWAKKIQQRIRTAPSLYKMGTVVTPWPTKAISGNRGVRFHSAHSRNGAAVIAVSHTLLRFY